MTGTDPENPKDRPWLRSSQARPPKLPFDGLDSVLTLSMALAVVAGVIALILALADSDDASFLAAFGFFGSAITCALGRVLIFIAQTLHNIAMQGRGLGRGTK